MSGPPPPLPVVPRQDPYGAGYVAIVMPKDSKSLKRLQAGPGRRRAIV